MKTLGCNGILKIMNKVIKILNKITIYLIVNERMAK